MNILVPMMLFGWFPITLALYAVFRPATALTISFLTGWLFLPFTVFPVQGIPEFDKFFVVSIANLLAASAMQRQALLSVRPSLCDVPMVIYCVVPLASSITNDLGAYDGFSAMVRQAIVWGIPYFLGRALLNDWNSLKVFAIGISCGGLFYVPFCWLEIRVSPQISNIIYGVSTFASGRFGGWRPSVFLSNGLELGMWMSAATLITFCVWSGKIAESVCRVPAVWAVIIILVTTVFCKSTGALLLLITGLTVFWISRKYETRIPVFLLGMAIPFYVFTRTNNLWDGRSEVRLISEHFDAERAESFDFRLRNEDILAEKALQQPLFGWGGWGRSRVYNEEGRDVSITDGLWIIVFGVSGFTGLSALVGIFTCPAFLCLSKSQDLQSPEKSAWLGLAIVVTLFGIDCLVNAMINPIYTLALGGVVSTASIAIRPQKLTPQPATACRSRRKLNAPFLRHAEELYSN